MTVALNTLERTAVELRAAIALEKRRNKFAKLFPNDDTVDELGVTYHARSKYPKHVGFFALGLEHNERAFMAANRVGKTIVGAYEAAAHLTGAYPEWWEGYRFHGPVDGWAGSDTSETTRDIVQLALLGPPGDFGTK